MTATASCSTFSGHEQAWSETKAEAQALVFKEKVAFLLCLCTECAQARESKRGSGSRQHDHETVQRLRTNCMCPGSGGM